jgi:hypothetical protein
VRWERHAADITNIAMLYYGFVEKTEGRESLEGLELEEKRYYKTILNQ